MPPEMRKDYSDQEGKVQKPQISKRLRSKSPKKVIGLKEKANEYNQDHPENPVRRGQKRKRNQRNEVCQPPRIIGGVDYEPEKSKHIVS